MAAGSPVQNIHTILIWISPHDREDASIVGFLTLIQRGDQFLYGAPSGQLDGNVTVVGELDFQHGTGRLPVKVGSVLGKGRLLIITLAQLLLKIVGVVEILVQIVPARCELCQSGRNLGDDIFFRNISGKLGRVGVLCACQTGKVEPVLANLADDAVLVGGVYQLTRNVLMS